MLPKSKERIFTLVIEFFFRNVAQIIDFLQDQMNFHNIMGYLSQQQNIGSQSQICNWEVQCTNYMK